MDESLLAAEDVALGKLDKKAMSYRFESACMHLRDETIDTDGLPLFAAEL